MTAKIIAFQGAFGANSNLACQNFYPDLDLKNYSSFSDVFNAVESGEVDYGMIPLENSYAGRVSEIHNLLSDKKVSIIAEHFQPISHNLAAIKGAKIEDLTEAYSHPQALMQCQSSLNEIGLKSRDFSNTAEAAKFISETGDKTKAVICSQVAAELYDLEIIKKDIQDAGDNMTIFIVIAKEPADVDPQDRRVITTLLFTVRNIPGALYKALGGFATNHVSMLKLESYIPGGFSSQAKFFISIEGHPSQRNIALGLEELGFFSKNIKLLGVYKADEKRFENK